MVVLLIGLCTTDSIHISLGSKYDLYITMPSTEHTVQKNGTQENRIRVKKLPRTTKNYARKREASLLSAGVGAMEEVRKDWLVSLGETSQKNKTEFGLPTSNAFV